MTNIPIDSCKYVAHCLHDRGLEFTPAQVQQALVEACAELRDCLRQFGVAAPAGDVELVLWLKELGEEE